MSSKNLSMKVVLLGYMASGKSSIGKLLAKSLNYDFVDLDEEIAKQVGMNVPDIFSKKGELFFRKMETQVLTSILQEERAVVVSLGGGTPCYGQNMELINTHTSYSFYLNLPIPNLVERIEKEKENRPLVAAIPNKELPEFIGKHLFERAPFYAKAAQTIFTQNKTKEEVVNEIAEYLV